jgi:hypothetical protein
LRESSQVPGLVLLLDPDRAPDQLSLGRDGHVARPHGRFSVSRSVTLSGGRQVGRRLVTVHREPPDDIALAEDGLVANYALEVQHYVHVEPAVAIVSFPDFHPADERARIPLAEAVHKHPGAFIEHEEVEVLAAQRPFQSGWSWITVTRQ